MKVDCPHLAAVKQSADDAGIVYCHFGCGCELGALPDTCGEPTKCCCSLPDALVDLSIKGWVVTDCGPKVPIG